VSIANPRDAFHRLGAQFGRQVRIAQRGHEALVTEDFLDGLYSSSVNIYFDDWKEIQAQSEDGKLGLAFTEPAPAIGVPGVRFSPTFQMPGGTRLSLQIHMASYESLGGKHYDRSDVFLTALLHECKHAFAAQFFGDALFGPLDSSFIGAYNSSIQEGKTPAAAAYGITYPDHSQWRLTRNVWRSFYDDQADELHRVEKLGLKFDWLWSGMGRADKRQWWPSPDDLSFKGRYLVCDWRDWLVSHTTQELQKRLTEKGVTQSPQLTDLNGLARRLWKNMREKFRRAAKEEMFSRGSRAVDAFLKNLESEE
jgi:hypothetical protein